MNSSKRRDKRSRRATDSGPRQKPKKRSVRPFILVSLLLLAVLGLVVQRLFFTPSHEEQVQEKLLEDGRSQLEKAFAASNIDQRRAAAELAEQKLEQYIFELGERAAEAKLLLVSALLVQHLSGRDWTTADQVRITGFLQYLETEQCGVDDLLNAASMLAQSGRYAEADVLIGAALKRSEKRSKTLNNAIEIRYGLGRKEDALRHCKELVKLTPDDPYVWERMARIYRDLARHDQEVEAYRKLIELAPQYASDFRHRLLLKLIELGKTSESRALFDQLRHEAPEVVSKSPVTEAKLLHLEGDVTAARSILEQVLTSDPDNRDGLLLLGRIQFVDDDFAGAIKTLQRLIAIDPTDARAHYLLGQAYARDEQPELAQERLAIHKRVSEVRDQIEHLQRVADRSPKNVPVRQAIAALYRQIGAEQRAKYWEFAAGEAARLSN